MRASFGFFWGFFVFERASSNIMWGIQKSQSKYPQRRLKKKQKQTVSANTSLKAPTAPKMAEIALSINTLALLSVRCLYYTPRDQWDRVKNEAGFVAECAVCVGMHLKLPRSFKHGRKVPKFTTLKETALN